MIPYKPGMKDCFMKRPVRTVTFFVSFSLLLFACSPETEDCPRYHAGIIPAGDQTLLKQILAKDTMYFTMNDTLRVFMKSDSSRSSRFLQNIQMGPCGTGYYPEVTTISYKLNFGPPNYLFRIEQKPVYPEGQQLTFRFFNGYYYNILDEAFSFDPTAANQRELSGFRLGDTIYQSVKVIPSDLGGHLFISQNGDILEIRTSDGKIFTKTD